MGKIGILVAAIVASAPSVCEAMSREDTLRLVTATVTSVQLHFARAQSAAPASAEYTTELTAAFNFGLKQMADLTNRLKDNPYVVVKGFSVNVGWPPGISVNLEWRPEDIQPKQ